MSACPVCDAEISDDSDTFECDGCTSVYHCKCGRVTKKEVTARKSAKNLRLYCMKCISSPTSCIAENVKTIMQFVYKLDYFNQQQVKKNEKFDRLISTTSEKVIEINQKLDAISEGQTSQETSSESFASISKKLDAIAKSKTNRETSLKSSDSSVDEVQTKSKVNPVVVVKPKNKQTSKKTMKVIKNTHKFIDCKRKVLKCVNCSSLKEKRGADIDVNHHAWSKNCVVFQRKIDSLKSKIEYSREK